MSVEQMKSVVLQTQLKQTNSVSAFYMNPPVKTPHFFACQNLLVRSNSFLLLFGVGMFLTSCHLIKVIIFLECSSIKMKLVF